MAAVTSVSNQSSADQAEVEAVIRDFMQVRSERYNFEAQWQETALIYLPEWANKFFYGYQEYPGAKKSQYQLDSYPSIASHRFMAIVNSLITPWTMNWSPLAPTGKDKQYLLKQKGVKDWFDTATDVLWTERYCGRSGFLGAQLINWLSLGVFGNQNMFVEERKDVDGTTGLAYSSRPVGEVYYKVNKNGMIEGFFRAMRKTAEQIHQQWPDTFPAELVPALEAKSPVPYWVLQYTWPNTMWQPDAIMSSAGKRYSSVYISITGNRILERGGYRSYPMPSGRYIVAPDENYGRGPGQIVLAAAKSRNAMKGSFLKQTHRKGDPVILTPDGGLLDASQFVPGDVVEGGWNSDGKPLVGVLPTGDVQEIIEAMKLEQEGLDDAFLVRMFDMALKTEDQPQLSVRQVMEIMEQRGQLLGPTVGRQYGEYLDVMVERELDLCSFQGKLPPLPGALKEAKDHYKPAWDGPLIRAMAAGDAAAFMQSVEMAAEVANSSQDMSVWDAFSFERAIPEMSTRRGVPSRWMATQIEIAKKAKGRQAQAERDARAKEMPAQAAIMKAQAISDKAQTGGNIGGTLSGVPAGGMPAIPGNQPGIPGRPGVGGRPGLPGRPGR